MAKQNVSILSLALRKLKDKSKSETKSNGPDYSELETAMSEFESASSPADKAKAFKAALDLAKDLD